MHIENIAYIAYMVSIYMHIENSAYIAYMVSI